MPKYIRPDGHSVTHVISLSVNAWTDGTFTGTISSWEPGGERIRCYQIPAQPCMSGVCPQGLEALQAAARWALEQWEIGMLR